MKIVKLLLLIIFISTTALIINNNSFFINSVWSSDKEDDDDKNLPDIANIIITHENIKETVDETGLFNMYLVGGGLFVFNNKISIKLITGRSWQLDVKVIDINIPEGAAQTASDLKIMHDQAAFYPKGFSPGFNDLSTKDLRIAESYTTRLKARRVFIISHALKFYGNEPAGEYSFILSYTLTSPA